MGEMLRGRDGFLAAHAFRLNGGAEQRIHKAARQPEGAMSIVSGRAVGIMRKASRAMAGAPIAAAMGPRRLMVPDVPAGAQVESWASISSHSLGVHGAACSGASW